MGRYIPAHATDNLSELGVSFNFEGIVEPNVLVEIAHPCQLKFFQRHALHLPSLSFGTPETAQAQTALPALLDVAVYIEAPKIVAAEQPLQETDATCMATAFVLLTHFLHLHQILPTPLSA